MTTTTHRTTPSLAARAPDLPLRGRRLSWAEFERVYGPRSRPANDNMEDTQLKAANDNRPRRASDFATLAERREWIAARPSNPKPVLAWPTAERLARQNKRMAAVLIRYRDLIAPGKFVAANDNDDQADGIREIRPSLKEIAAAIDADLVVNFTTLDTANTGWSIQMVEGHPVCFQGDYTHLGSMTFLRGALQSYDRYTRKDGKPGFRRPRELWRHPKGSKPKLRSATAVRFLVKDELSVATGAAFLAGVMGGKGTTAPRSAQHMVDEEMERRERCRAVRVVLGSESWLLDMALTDASAAEIGRAMGLDGKRAERQAIRAINAALEKIEKLVA